MNKFYSRIDTETHLLSHINQTYMYSVFIGLVISLSRMTPSSTQNIGKITSGIFFIHSISGIDFTSKLNCIRLWATSPEPVSYSVETKCWPKLTTTKTQYLRFQRKRKANDLSYSDKVPIRYLPKVAPKKQINYIICRDCNFQTLRREWKVKTKYNSKNW